MDRIGRALSHFAPARPVAARPTPRAHQDGAPLFSDADIVDIAAIIRTYIKGVALLNDMLDWIDRSSVVGSKVPPAAVKGIVGVAAQLTRSLEKLKPVVEGFTRLCLKYDLVRLQIQKQYDAIDDQVFELECEAALRGIE